MREHTFHDIDHVIDEVHDFFEAWVQGGTPRNALALDEYGFLVMKLAVHEWIANLVQFATFGDRPPMIRLVISQHSSGLHCLIEDNSEGFDFQASIEEQTKILNRPEPSERGRGLLMMLACTEEFVYKTNGDGLQHLEFVVRPPVDSDDMPSFLPPSDQAFDKA